MNCHHTHEIESPLIKYILDSNILGVEGISLILALFVYGIVGSFTHCIGMCGPIALGQMNIRLMNLSKNQLTNWHKLNCALSLSYYFGKASTYVILAFLAKFFAISLSGSSFFRVLAFSLLIIFALVCLRAAVVQLIPMKKELKLLSNTFQVSRIFKFFESYILRLIEFLSLNPFGVRGFFMGMILGLIPCGLVISSIMLITSYSNNILVASLAMFCFGVGTFPGLFIVSFFGQNVMLKAKKYLSFIYSLFMLINFILLFKFALRLL